jgi:deoxycytidine triphosphate deaminase
MLNVKQVIEEGLLKLDETKGAPAQVGYDLSLKAVQQISGKGVAMGKVLKSGTTLTTYTPMSTIMVDGAEGWILYAGVYDLTFNEGCNIPDNRTGFIKQRSSLYRNGTIINSAVFDPGFKTDNMGTVAYVFETIFIEKDARVAQMYFHENESAEKYDGQWQNDKQRNG